MNPEEPSPPAAPRNPLLGGLADLDPGELLAMGLRTVRPSHGAQSWVPPTPEELAALLPQHGITALLGCGGMGAVYRGVQSALDRPVAIKLLSAELAADEQFIARFQREARTLAKLQHPGIVTVYEFGQTSAGHPYFVMEFVEGTDLQRILRGPGLNPEQALTLISQVCDALHYAHRQGVIHRDIKPANILVTADGRAKVADFGLSRPLAEDTSVLTSANAIMGTDAYMAPEQRTGHADARADIYALGVMLYEMLTGQRPHGVFDPPSRKVQVDIRLDEVVLKALQEEPARRYQQAGEMKTDVDHIRTTPPQTSPQKPTSSPRKTWSLAAAGALAITVIASIFIWKGGELRKATRAAEVAPARAAATSDAPPRPLSKSEAAALAEKLPGASKEQPFVNSLGMKFVPVPGTNILFSIWETRVRDYAEFAKANDVDAEWTQPTSKGMPVPQGPDHPVIRVSWTEAKTFCDWLTKTELSQGVLPAGATYRLPTDHQWSCAVGIGNREDETAMPSNKNGVIPDYPWGAAWPPPSGAGNFGDEATYAKFGAVMKERIIGYRDEYSGTAPVGSFRGNILGIFDLAGNAGEYCEDRADTDGAKRIVRGGSWFSPHLLLLVASRRQTYPATARIADYGFRCVLDQGGDYLAQNRVSAKVVAVSAGNSEKTAPRAPTGQIPRQIGRDNDWISVAVGESHALAIKANGSLWAWGKGSFGQLGVGVLEDKREPVRIGSDIDWKTAAARADASFAIKTDGSLWAWGRNRYGCLGDGTEVNRPAPTRVGTGTDWTGLALAAFHTLALKADGTLWGWGANQFGQRSTGPSAPQLYPKQIGTDHDWTCISAAYGSGGAIKADGSLWGWGDNRAGQLGLTTAEKVPNPVRIGPDGYWIAVETRQTRSFVIGKDQTLWGSGGNEFGKLGIGSKAARSDWTAVGGNRRWTLVAATVDSTFALQADGSLWAWGHNHRGQLGDGSTIDRLSPVRIGADGRWVSISAGENGAAGIRGDGSLWVWGVEF